MKKEYYIIIDGQQIPVSEEVYRAYKQPLWAEHKRIERAKRCRDENGFRCTEDCGSCAKTRNGSALSLDKFSEDGFDIADQSDIAELVAEKLLFAELFAAIDDLDPDEKALVDALFFRERTERAYAAEIGISHQAVGKRKKKVIEKLRNLMNADNR